MAKRTAPRPHAPTTGGASANGGLHFTIPSDYAAMREVQDAILGRVEAAGFDDESTFAIRLSLEEALINAIKHGNKLDPKKRVHVDAKVEGECCWVTIRDEGPGFTRKEIPDPTLEENLCKCSGRGLLLIEAYMHEIAYADGGRQLTMKRCKAKPAA